MDRKIRVGVLFGGRSAEHEVSLQSARSVIDALDHDRYEVVLIAIDKSGQWVLNEATRFLLEADNPKLIKLNQGVANPRVALMPGEKSEQLISVSAGSRQPGPIDVIFPVLHGTYGEDGTVQGLLKLADLPFVGAGVLGSAVGMDKDVMKRLLRDAGLPVAKFLVCHRKEKDRISFEYVVKELGLPLFVKPANLGSSVGVVKVKSEADFNTALDEAFEYDNKILFEEFVPGREIECSVLGNDDPIASVPGEIIPQHEFYSYEAKYIDENGAILKVPAELSPDLIADVQHLAVETFKTCCCEGMARVDFFLKDNGQFIINEINTIPGFTKISMYPKLFEASGIPYKELVDRLIGLAIERFERDSRLKTSRVD